MEKRNNLGQMKLSFGMIFSIILIIIFIAFAFYAISKFLGVSDSLKINKFNEELQQNVDKLYRGVKGSEEVVYNLPGKIEYVCLADFKKIKKGDNENLYSELKRNYYGDENLFFYPPNAGEGLDIEIEHINLEEITLQNNPYCFNIVEGKVKLILEKGFSESLVRVK